MTQLPFKLHPAVVDQQQRPQGHLETDSTRSVTPSLAHVLSQPFKVGVARLIGLQAREPRLHGDVMPKHGRVGGEGDGDVVHGDVRHVERCVAVTFGQNVEVRGVVGLHPRLIRDGDVDVAVAAGGLRVNNTALSVVDRCCLSLVSIFSVSVSLFFFLSFFLSVCLSVCLSVSLSRVCVCVFVCVYVCFCVRVWPVPNIPYGFCGR